jgi:putative hemolysin
VVVEGRTIRVIELDGRRISRLLVGPPPEPEPDDESADEPASSA